MESPEQPLAERTFDVLDNRAFAEVSGDANPLHVDPLFARRTLFGGVVSHGLHSALWALDAFCARHEDAMELTGFRAEFLNPAAPGDTQQCFVEFVDGDRVKLRVRGPAKDTATVEFDWRAQSIDESRSIDAVPDAGSPDELAMDDLPNAQGSLPLHYPRTSVSAMFPNLDRVLPADQIAFLLASTRVVGMRCPGLHSIYLGLKSKFEKADIASNEVSYSVRRAQLATGFTTLDLSAPGVTCSVNAVFRPQPTEQPSFATVKSLVNATEFENERVLVLGGSRGLGEVAAKIFAAGGADVTITYASGLADATRLQDELAESGNKLGIALFNVLNDQPVQSTLPVNWKPSVVLYFPTPHIVIDDTERFVHELFERYTRVYVDGFWRIATELIAAGDELRAIFYPSTVYMEENLPKASEYIAAKGAGEALCRLLETINPALRVCAPRLPRMVSDQAVSIMPYDYPDTLGVMLPLMRELAGKGS